MEGRGGEGGVRERREARGGRGLWSEEHVISQSQALVSGPQRMEGGGVASADGLLAHHRGASAAPIWRKPPGELPLLKELLILHLLQLLAGLHLGQLFALLTHLLKDRKGNRHESASLRLMAARNARYPSVCS